ncbi:MAG TPA: putative toxin-antitoxin system toxin component, PIN family [Parapedobacter sp.]|uniref:putative toxin-antitoxin system toxin component, PIN family n=1 Tax=Parapedobacter sp. TaxID=1958893 RepID=UPI002CCD5A88|nr:putative toxin-antitoxin system toxin component, PIN family [Parapedobacter sp.]HWK59072.1 putative toxin-antitoxin system toxin component, PIN family [Parapedobacter sp.]
MKRIKLFVFDTNTLISSFLLPNSVARHALNRARRLGHIVLSKATADEFKGVFVRPKFDRYLPLAVRLEIIESFDSLAVYINPHHIVTDCRDPKDNKFLEIALSAKASAIITGDQDLLVLHPYKDIPIINAAAFLEQ